jgi:hypothetical protein
MKRVISLSFLRYWELLVGMIRIYEGVWRSIAGVLLDLFFCLSFSTIPGR